ncbi:Pentatricopeptide repeat-containing protein [Platanthera zijinensis]|uniref:Pentatricopeptide repeat-containing protein n=1 Tax=Platanthera zijinensis TaxID=2320716 RepID=A0AAP0B3E5_9ASPA
MLIADPPPSSLIDPNLVAVKLISAAASHGNPRHADLIFSLLPDPNLAAWNSRLKALADNRLYALALARFNSLLLLRPRLLPDEFSFTSILKCCAALAAASSGEASHAFIVAHGIASNLFVANSLVDIFSLRGDVGAARKLFDEMPSRTFVTWSAMISCHAKSGDTCAARHLFDQMPQKNIVVWNAMISGYAQNEKFSDSLKLFRAMLQSRSLRPNPATLVSVLSACAHLGALDSGRWIHSYIDRNAVELTLFLGNALADMYAKCGCIIEARKVFDELHEKDVISWSIIISGLAMFGHAEEAMSAFNEMLLRGTEPPNEITFMGILSACTHSGLVDAGLEYFRLMREEFFIPPTVEHYGCMVDLLSRAGRLNEAEDLIASMTVQPNVIVWGALLGGCRIYKDIERGERVVRRILQLDSEHSGSYVYLSTVYTSVGRLEEAAECRMKMRNKRVMKTPGCSWIEVDHAVYEFFMGDRSNPRSQEIYSRLGELRKKMKLAGYVPNTGVVSHSVGDEEKEDAISMHSEKLALVFGLISTVGGETIRIVKNLRVCDDCHEAFKVISKLEGREIILRDRSRFHQFKHGLCSCNDYW